MSLPLSSTEKLSKAKKILLRILNSLFPKSDFESSPKTNYFPTDFLVRDEMIAIDILGDDRYTPSELKSRTKYHEDSWYRYIQFTTNQLLHQESECRSVVLEEMKLTYKSKRIELEEMAQKDGNWIPGEIKDLSPRGEGYFMDKTGEISLSFERIFTMSLQLEIEERVEVLLDSLNERVICIRRT